MANDNVSLEQVKQMAEDIGMNKLSEEHLQQLLRATNAARARRKALQLDALIPSDEPAHVFHLTSGDQR